MNIVLLLNKKALQRLITEFKAYQSPSKNPYILFFARVEHTTISVYNSDKVVFQGNKAEEFASEFGYNSQTNVTDQTDIIGTDEVGNGSYFGSLVVVASFVNQESFELLKKWAVTDSKKLSDERICQIAPILIDKIPHSSLIANPSRYNIAINDGYNAVSIKVALHNQAIFLLKKKLAIDPKSIIIDAFTSKKNYVNYVKKEKNQISTPVTLLTKAEDKFSAVACSSVIARYLFLENLKTLSLQSGYSLPSGAGNNSDQIAAKIIQNFGITTLGKFAKLHFANTQKALNLLKNEAN